MSLLQSGRCSAALADETHGAQSGSRTAPMARVWDGKRGV